MTGFVLKRPDDEQLEVYLNTVNVVCVNHDEYGWAGISLVEDMVRDIAIVLNIPVTEE